LIILITKTKLFNAGFKCKSIFQFGLVIVENINASSSGY